MLFGASLKAIEMIRRPSAIRLPVRQWNGTGPTPIVDTAFQSNKCLGVGIAYTVFVAITAVLTTDNVAGSSGNIERKTLFFSSLIARGSSAVGGSIATNASTWKRCVTTMSLYAPVTS